MAEALVNPELIQWARQRAAIPVDVLANKLKTKVEKIIAWEKGEARPTFRQAERLARFVHVPFGYLFLPEPPEEALPIPDLRSPVDTQGGAFSAEFLDQLRDVMFKLDWFRDYLLDHGAEPLSFVGKFSTVAAVETVAADIRDLLHYGPAERPCAGSLDDHLRWLFDQCERIGIWILKSGCVGSNTHRPLSVSEFRGFAIADKVVPVIFVNGRDAKAAQAFTLAHELAHIWLGQSGVSDPFLDRRMEDAREIERICNAVAAEVLAPHRLFLERWNDDASLEHNAEALARHFKVSRVVIARRALDLGKIGWDQHHAFFEKEKAGWLPPENGGGDFYRAAPVNRPGFPRGVFVQNSGGFFKGVQVCMEFLLHFLRRPVADGAM